jgi:hypothetical protein
MVAVDHLANEYGVFASDFGMSQIKGVCKHGASRFSQLMLRLGGDAQLMLGLLFE